jgi:V/A-type H+-transporting ATPase subunit F
MRYFAISDNRDTLTGLRLAGIEGVRAQTAEEVRTAVRNAVADHGIGILLITQQLSRLCPDLIDDLKMNAQRPLVVEIPGRFDQGRTSDSITRYIREAIGVKI